MIATVTVGPLRDMRGGVTTMTLTMTVGPLGGMTRITTVTPMVTMGPLGGMTKGITTVTPMVTMGPLGGMTKSITTVTPMVTMTSLRGMTKGITTVTPMVLMVTIFNEEAWRVIASGTEGEMDCQKVYVLAVEEEKCTCDYVFVLGAHDTRYKITYT